LTFQETINSEDKKINKKNILVLKNKIKKEEKDII